MRWLLGAVGALWVVGQTPAEAHLRVRSPEVAAEIWLVGDAGARSLLGEAGNPAVSLPSGRHRVCLVAPWAEPLCREFDLVAAQTHVWQVWLSDFTPLPAARCRVALPARVTTAAILVDGRTRATVHVSWDTSSVVPMQQGIWVEVPVRTEAWILMTDATEGSCSCKVPSLDPGEEYTCWWDCR